ncbi:MAG TPA: signal peptidase II [Ktedonobacterales bacterium]|jgi:signal peptidase II
MKLRGYFLYVLLALTGAIVIGLDQWSKAAIRQHFGVCPSPSDMYIPLVGQYFGIVYACNTGSAFSFFEHGQQALLYFFIAVALATVVWLYVRFARHANALLQVIFGLVLGGAVGNLIDRFHLGYVTDFLLFRIPPAFSFPVFNLADSSICVGIFLLILYFWRRPVGEQQAAPVEQEGTSMESSSANQSSTQ